MLAAGSAHQGLSSSRNRAQPTLDHPPIAHMSCPGHPARVSCTRQLPAHLSLSLSLSLSARGLRRRISCTVENSDRCKGPGAAGTSAEAMPLTTLSGNPTKCIRVDIAKSAKEACNVIRSLVAIKSNRIIDTKKAYIWSRRSVRK